MATPLLGTDSAANSIQRVRYTHDALIDHILAKPEASQEELAKMVGFTGPWVSRVMCSDAFQKRLAERKTELIDPIIVAEIEEKLRVATKKSLNIIQERLDALPVGSTKTELALETLKVTTKALGYGARDGKPSLVQNFVVALPEKSKNQEEWVSEARQKVVDVIAKEVQNV